MSISYPLIKLARILGGAVSNPKWDKLEINDVSVLSNEVQTGGLFVAINGVKTNGHDYIEAAFNAGCSAALVSDAEKLHERPGIIVRDTRVSVSKLAALFSGNPTVSQVLNGLTNRRQ